MNKICFYISGECPGYFEELKYISPLIKKYNEQECGDGAYRDTSFSSLTTDIIENYPIFDP